MTLGNVLVHGRVHSPMWGPRCAAAALVLCPILTAHPPAYPLPGSEPFCLRCVTDKFTDPTDCVGLVYKAHATAAAAQLLARTLPNRLCHTEVATFAYAVYAK